MNPVPSRPAGHRRGARIGNQQKQPLVRQAAMKWHGSPHEPDCGNHPCFTGALRRFDTKPGSTARSAELKFGKVLSQMHCAEALYYVDVAVPAGAGAGATLADAAKQALAAEAAKVALAEASFASALPPGCVHAPCPPQHRAQESAESCVRASAADRSGRRLRSPLIPLPCAAALSSERQGGAGVQGSGDRGRHQRRPSGSRRPLPPTGVH